MPAATKDLSVLGASIELVVDGLKAAKGTFQYIAGTGTITLQATLQNSDPAVWFTIQDIDGVDIAPLTAVGAVNFDIAGYTRIRAINTLAGSGNLSALGFN